MTFITLVLASAALALGLSQWWRLPAIPLLILAGLTLSETGLSAQQEQVHDALMLGLAVLVFAVGTELNPLRFREQAHAAVRVGLTQFFLIGAIALAAGLALGFEMVPALYVAVAVTASSTLVVVNLLQERRWFFEPFGRLVLGVLLVQDVLVIFFIVVLSRLDGGGSEVVTGVISTFGLVLLSLIFIRWITPLLLLKLGLDEESHLLSVLAILFGYVALAALLDLPMVVGAFLAGFSLSGFPVSGSIRGQLNSISNFFHVLFFVALGATLTLPTGSELMLAAFLIALVLLLTPPLVTVIAEKAGLNARTAIEGGLLLAQTSEFSLVLALIGMAQGHIDQGLLSVIALVTVVTMILTPFVATSRNTWRLMRLHPSRRRGESAERPSDHLLLIGCGQTGLRVLEQLHDTRLRLVAVDNDPALVQKLKEQGIEALRGDGADYNVLEAAGARFARVVISTMPRVRDHLSLLKFVGNRNVLVRVFEENDAELIRARGGIPVLYSHAAADDFLRWFDARLGVEPEEKQTSGKN